MWPVLSDYKLFQLGIKSEAKTYMLLQARLCNPQFKLITQITFSPLDFVINDGSYHLLVVNYVSSFVLSTSPALSHLILRISLGDKYCSHFTEEEAKA